MSEFNRLTDQILVWPVSMLKGNQLVWTVDLYKWSFKGAICWLLTYFLQIEINLNIWSKTFCVLLPTGWFEVLYLNFMIGQAI